MTAQGEGLAGVGAAGGSEKVAAMLRGLRLDQLLELCGTAVRGAADYRLLHSYEYAPGKWMHNKAKNQEVMDGLVDAIERELAARLPEHDRAAPVCLSSADTAPLEPALQS
jgi:hypothetical protein